MHPRPRGLIAMSGYAYDQALPPPVRERLVEVADIDPARRFDDLTGPEARDTLAHAEFLLTGWGAPEVTGDVLDHAPRLRLIAHAAGSVKHHLGPVVWRRGVAVSSAADANAEPVAEYTRAMILLACKRAFTLSASYAREGWPSDERRLGTGYPNRTVGVVGASRIGRATLRLLDGLGMRLLVQDPFLTAEDAAELGARPVDLDELCASSDVVTVHAPQLPETRHLIDDRRLSLMRDGAVLVNTARGSLVDTDALTAHCADGRIDAILDVTDPEPLPPGHPLLLLPNVLVTPHVAGAQGTEIARLGEYAVAEVERFFTGRPLAGAVLVEQLSTMA